MQACKRRKPGDFAKANEAMVPESDHKPDHDRGETMPDKPVPKWVLRLFLVPVAVSVIATLLTMPPRWDHAFVWATVVICIGFWNWLADELVMRATQAR